MLCFNCQMKVDKTDHWSCYLNLQKFPKKCDRTLLEYFNLYHDALYTFTDGCKFCPWGCSVRWITSTTIDLYINTKWSTLYFLYIMVACTQLMYKVDQSDIPDHGLQVIYSDPGEEMINEMVCFTRRKHHKSLWMISSVLANDVNRRSDKVSSCLLGSRVMPRAIFLHYTASKFGNTFSESYAYAMHMSHMPSICITFGKRVCMCVCVCVCVCVGDAYMFTTRGSTCFHNESIPCMCHNMGLICQDRLNLARKRPHSFFALHKSITKYNMPRDAQDI